MGSIFFYQISDNVLPMHAFFTYNTITDEYNFNWNFNGKM